MTLLFITISCVKEDYFGKSDFKKIIYFSLSDQIGNSKIIEDSLLIRITVSNQADLTQLYLDSVWLSSYASISPGEKVKTDFTNPVIYTVTAEDGSKADYTVLVVKESGEPQLENPDFADWYTPAGKNYMEPGKDLSSIWASANAGVVTLGDPNTYPTTIGGVTAAELKTLDLGPLAQITGQRMGSATLFTGKFVLDITNPPNSPKFGISFTARPISFSFRFLYEPGLPYKNGNGMVLSKTDSCDVYLILENRSGPDVKRIATGWFRNGDLVSALTEKTIPLHYGSLPAGSPQYEYPANGVFGDANDPVTHLTMVFVSSAYGITYEGGVNSRLAVTGVILNY